MRYLFVTKRLKGRSVALALAVASALLSLPVVASADAIYRWRDVAGRLHFSNDSGRVPQGAELAKLPELSVARPSPAADDRTLVAESPSAVVYPSTAPPLDTPECDVADPSRLIEAVESRLESMRSGGRESPRLTLFIAGTPVSYSSNANIEVLPAGESDETAATDQAAIAYPASGACPRTPLERYEATVTSPVRSISSSSGLCADYRRASEEIEIALSRNENVARTFEMASARFESLRADGEASEGGRRGNVKLSPWLVEVVAAQTGELAAEIEEFMEELTVAREEIDSAAQAWGCW